jgi:hypothetical protein
MIMTDTQLDYQPSRDAYANPIPNGPRTIRQAIEAAVDQIEDDAITRLSSEEVPPFAQARAVLGALTLCYARQIYHSADAALVVARDLSFPARCGEALPDADRLRRFRAENRPAIHRCLTAALQFLVEQKISSGVVTKVNVRQVAEEAHRRIIMAMFADSTERGDDPPE